MISFISGTLLKEFFLLFSLLFTIQKGFFYVIFTYYYINRLFTPVKNDKIS